MLSIQLVNQTFQRPSTCETCVGKEVPHDPTPYEPSVEILQTVIIEKPIAEHSDHGFILV